MPPRTRVPAPLTTFAAVAAASTRPDAIDVLYPTGTGSVEAQLEEVRRAYRRFAALVHPDQNRTQASAAAVFNLVTELRQRRERDIEERGAPALPPRGGFTSKRAGSGSIVRAAHEAIAAWDDGYDDTEPPPLPACACVTLARATLPGRVVFCERSGQDWAVRTSDQRAIVVVHTTECHRYRWANPEATGESAIVMQSAMFSHHVPGWCWSHSRLVKQPVVDHFAQR